MPGAIYFDGTLITKDLTDVCPAVAAT